jgi:hypothetical protein
MREAETRRLELYERSKPIQNDPGLCEKHEDEWAHGKFSDPELQALYDAFHDRLRKIEREMRRYRWIPTVRASEFLGLHQVFIWPGRRDSGEYWENFAVFWLTGHISGSGLSPAPILRFRQCRQCSKWFYAMTDHQTYCSGNCRQKHHADSPEFRARRATYMREKFRPRQKEEDQKAMEGVNHAKAKKA